MHKLTLSENAEHWMLNPVYRIWKMYPEYLYKLQEWVPNTKPRKKFHTNLRVYPWTLFFFEVRPPSSPNINSLDFFLCGHLKTSIKMVQKIHRRIFETVKPFASAQEPLKWCNIQNVRRCVVMHWFRWRMFPASVVNCDSINSKDWTHIQLGRCTVNVLSFISKMFHSYGINFWI